MTKASSLHQRLSEQRLYRESSFKLPLATLMKVNAHDYRYFILGKPQKKYKLAIVGCGAISRELHLKSILRFPSFQVSTLCDTNLEFAELAKLEYGLDAELTQSIDGFAGQIDAALVAVPPRLHAPLSMQLMEMGIDVMVEKPTADSAAEAQQMADKAQAMGRVISVGLTHRYIPANTLLKKLLAHKALGDIIEVVGELGAPLDWTMTTDAYYNKNTTRGGVFYDVGVHMIDRVMWLFGALDNINYQDDSYGGVESNGLFNAELDIDGSTVPFRGAFSWTHMLSNCLRVVGTEATAELRLSDPNHLYLRRNLGEETIDMLASTEQQFENMTPVDLQWQDFLASVESRNAPVTSIETTVAPLSAIESAYKVRHPIPQPWVDTGRSAI